MKMNFNLNLVQTQKLVMTPELKQAIEILQYNSLELNEFIQEELLSNPILEKGVSESNEPVEKNQNEDQDLYSKDKVEDNLDKIDWKDISEEYRLQKNRRTAVESGEAVNFDNFLSSEKTLTEYLIEQLNFTMLDHHLIHVGLYVIENIDSNGYLKLNNDYVYEKFNIDEDDLETVIQTIQTFEPIGVGARDLMECLLIQVVHREIDDKYVYQVINDHLEELASNKLQVISKAQGISMEKVQAIADLIKRLEPKPGRAYFSGDDVRYITPDVTLKIIDDEYVILVNESSAPKLQINSYYRKLLSELDTSNNTSSYITKKLTGALRIIRSIEQRRNTMYKVVESILNFQKDFFEKGKVHLKTLTLKDVAEEIGVHESTVSRAVNGKYLQCPRGLYELKFFFQSGVSSVYGGSVSSESVKTIIQELVEKENPRKPISDQFISNELNEIGIKISRRTIAKYRDELNIPSSSKRKRY